MGRIGMGLGLTLIALVVGWSAGIGKTGDVLGALLCPAQLTVDPPGTRTDAYVTDTTGGTFLA